MGCQGVGGKEGGFIGASKIASTALKARDFTRVRAGTGNNSGVFFGISRKTLPVSIAARGAEQEGRNPAQGSRGALGHFHSLKTVTSLKKRSQSLDSLNSIFPKR